MSQTRSMTFTRFLLLLLGLGGLAAAFWLMFFGEPTLQRTGLGLAALVVGGVILVRWTHRSDGAGASQETETDLGNEHLAPNDPLAWMDAKKKDDVEHKTGEATVEGAPQAAPAAIVGIASEGRTSSSDGTVHT